MKIELCAFKFDVKRVILEVRDKLSEEDYETLCAITNTEVSRRASLTLERYYFTLTHHDAVQRAASFCRRKHIKSQFHIEAEVRK